MSCGVACVLHFETQNLMEQCAVHGEDTETGEQCAVHSQPNLQYDARVPMTFFLRTDL